MSGDVLVTGANGFVGSAVVERLSRDGVAVRAAVRRTRNDQRQIVRTFDGLDLCGNTDWSTALCGVQTVIHCAARVHVMHDTAGDPLAEFRRTNLAGTLALASQAAEAGVKRMVFVSSIGVNGAETSDRAFQADDSPAPHSPYAVSKLDAEVALRELSTRTGLEVTIVRPPLVYGPNAPGNFGTFLRAIVRGVPLPLGAVDNRRSLVAIDNLVDLLVRCANHRAAAGQTFLVSDDEDVSTTVLLRRIAAALGCRARLFPVPVKLLMGVGRLLGKATTMQSLCGSLQIDMSKTQQLLHWSPVIGMDEALARTVQGYVAK